MAQIEYGRWLELQPNIVRYSDLDAVSDHPAIDLFQYFTDTFNLKVQTEFGTETTHVTDHVYDPDSSVDILRKHIDADRSLLLMVIIRHEAVMDDLILRYATTKGRIL